MLALSALLGSQKNPTCINVFSTKYPPQTDGEDPNDTPLAISIWLFCENIAHRSYRNGDFKTWNTPSNIHIFVITVTYWNTYASFQFASRKQLLTFLQLELVIPNNLLTQVTEVVTHRIVLEIRNFPLFL